MNMVVISQVTNTAIYLRIKNSETILELFDYNFHL